MECTLFLRGDKSLPAMEAHLPQPLRQPLDIGGEPDIGWVIANRHLIDGKVQLDNVFFVVELILPNVVYFSKTGEIKFVSVLGVNLNNVGADS